MVPGAVVAVALVLASKSPRRTEILTALGIEHSVVGTDVEEITEGDPEQVVLENARRKAEAALTTALPRPRDGGREAEHVARLMSLGADTEVAIDGRVLGKAADEAAAREHLAALSGRTHEVLTGVVIVGPDGERSGVARSEVTFRELEPDTIERYLASGEWRDRAGAYAIQGLGSILIARLEGDFSNVVGLPVPLLLRLAPGLFPQFAGKIPPRRRPLD